VFGSAEGGEGGFETRKAIVDYQCFLEKDLDRRFELLPELFRVMGIGIQPSLDSVEAFGKHSQGNTLGALVGAHAGDCRAEGLLSSASAQHQKPNASGDHVPHKLASFPSPKLIHSCRHAISPLLAAENLAGLSAVNEPQHRPLVPDRTIERMAYMITSYH
jgi:hypothetical protein